LAKLIIFVVCLHLVMSVISSIWQGSGGYVIHQLTTDLTSAGTTINVDTSVNYYAPSVVQIGDEKILISAIPAGGVTLTVGANGRGYYGTTPIAHKAGSQVYSEDAGGINNAIQTRIARIADASGPLAAFDVTAQILGIASAFLVSPFTMFGSDLWFISALYTAILVGLFVVIGLQMFGSRRV
jgi:hypothetical protein